MITNVTAIFSQNLWCTTSCERVYMRAEMITMAGQRMGQLSFFVIRMQVQRVNGWSICHLRMGNSGVLPTHQTLVGDRRHRI